MYPEHYGNNPMFPKTSDFKVIKKDNDTGYGVMTYKRFNKGDLIAAISGEVISDIRQHSLQIEPGKHLYDVYFTGYLLHSCDPNVFLDMKNMKLFAIKDIHAYDYLYMDYAQTEDVLYKQFPCSCNSANCRGWIIGKKEKLVEFKTYQHSSLSL
jgi:hypothetical protein